MHAQHGYPKNLRWDDHVGSWTESEGTSTAEQCEHYVGSLALHVVGQELNQKFLSLLGRLGTCEGVFELPHRPGHIVPGNARGLVAGRLLPRGLLSHQERSSSHHGRKECGERK